MLQFEEESKPEGYICPLETLVHAARGRHATQRVAACSAILLLLGIRVVTRWVSMNSMVLVNEN